MELRSETELYDLMRKLLDYAEGMPSLGEIPEVISLHMPKARELVELVATEVGAATHGAYFTASRNRYANYFAAGMHFLPPSSTVLDIGNAPGHVGIGFTLMGHRVRGLNLNAEWRKTYPSAKWLEHFQVVEADIESTNIPFESESFDAILFTEVLEHIAIRHPNEIVRDMHRVLKKGGLIIFSTPNVCNISNLYALLKGKNIFWPPEIFYGSLDRHNREYAPYEVDRLMLEAGFEPCATWGLNDYSNWRGDGAEFANIYVENFGMANPMCRNTIAGVYGKRRHD